MLSTATFAFASDQQTEEKPAHDVSACQGMKVMLFTPSNHSSADKHRTLDELPIIEKDIMRARRQAQDHLEPRKQLIRRRLPFIMLFACGGTALFLLAGLMLPPAYTAKALLIVDPQVRPQIDASNDGVASRVAEMANGSAALAIETHMGVLNSRDFLQHAVSGLSAETPAEPVKPKPEPIRKKNPSTGILSQLSERLSVWVDALVKQPKSATPMADDLEKRIKIAQDGKSDIISITFSSSDPAFASEVVNRIVQSYVDNRTENLQASTKREIARVTANIAVVKSEVGRADASALSLLQRQPEASADGANQGKQFTYQRLRELTSEAANARLLQPSLQRRLGLLQAELANIKPDVRVLALAKTPQKPSSLNPIILAVPVLISLLVAGSWIATWLDKLDMRLRSEGDLHNCLGVPCVALLPKVRKRRFFQPKTREDLLGPELAPYAQAIRFLVASLHPEAAGDRGRRKARVVMAASSLPEEGKSTLCHSLGAFMASIGLKVLIVDFDKRGPQRDVPLLSTAGVLECIERLAPADADYLALGRSPGDLLRLLTSEEWANSFDALKRKYDYILLDCPPLLGVSDFRLVTPFADKILFLVKWESTKWDQARSAFRMLRNSGAPDDIMPVYTQVDLARQALYSSGALSDYFLNQRRYWASKAGPRALRPPKGHLAASVEQTATENPPGECETAKA